MGFIGGSLGYRLLKTISPDGVGKMTDGSAYAKRSKMEMLFGDELWGDVVDKTVIDFGCGDGRETLELARRGAKKVIGVDKLQKCLQQAESSAAEEGLSDRCSFGLEADEPGNTIISLDAFEHFDDPGEILDVMSGLLQPGGVIWIAFGPPWYHPYGAHGLSIFPWAHLIITESALMRWRADFKDDGATRFSEVDIGLNKMTTRRFVRIVESSKFRFDRLDLVPIRALRHVHNRLTKEFFTSVVRCRLVFE